MQVKIVSVSIEHVKQGKKDYSKAEVIYTFNGQARTQKLISFANPAVFAIVQEWENELPEGEVNIEVGKNDAGYNEWRSINASGAAPNAGSGSQTTPVSSAPKTATYAGGRDFETAMERAARQVLIVKQSSLTAALKQLEGANADKDEVIELAQFFADWVFEGNNNV